MSAKLLGVTVLTLLLVVRAPTARADDLPPPETFPGYEVVRKNVSLQLWDGGRKVWEVNA